MKNIKVSIMDIPSESQLRLISDAAALTQIRGYIPGTKPFNIELCARLKAMGHSSLFEFAHLTVFIENASRVFLSQITRHRMASYTSQSQQYQKHHGFDFVIPDGLSDKNQLAYISFMEQVEKLYGQLEEDAGRDVARYVLPGATCNNLLIGANLREWLEVIIPQRLCLRNTDETVYIMRLILSKLKDTPLRELFLLSGPSCCHSKCTQGKMSCGTPIKMESYL